MVSHYHAQLVQMRSRSVDTRQQSTVPGFDSVGAVSVGSSAEGLGWGQRAFGASGASGTGWGDSQQWHEQLLASRGWKPIPRAISTPDRSGSSATPSLWAQGTYLGGQGSQGGCRRRLLVGWGYTRHYQFKSNSPDQADQVDQEDPNDHT